MINKQISNAVLMIGVYYKNNAPGGMAAVIQYYKKYFEQLNYVASWKLGSKFTKIRFFIISFVQVLVQLIVNRKIKIVHIHSAADQSFWRKSIFIKLSKLFKKKVILHIHASRFKDFFNESNKKQKIISNILMADTVIVLSKSWKDWFTQIGIPANKIIVLNNIVDYPLICNSDNSDKKIKMLFLGELGDRKGVFDALKALSISPKEYLNKLSFRIGGNKNEEKLKNYITEHQLSSFVSFEGWVANKKKEELLNWANLFILPSYNEGLPISILEAMSYGCAIISTPVGGIPELLHDHTNGIIVQPGDINCIKNAIDFFINNPETCQDYGQKSKDFVKPFLPDSVINELNSIYKQLLNK